MALLMSLPLPFRMPGLKSTTHRGGLFSRGLSGRTVIGLGLGSLVAALAAFTLYRGRGIFGKGGKGGIGNPGASTWTRRNTAATAAAAATAASESATPVSAPPMEQASMDWILAGRGMDTLVPAAYSIPPLPESPGLTGKEPEETRGLVSDSAAPQTGSAITPDRLALEDLRYRAQSAARTTPEPWLKALREAMEHKPMKYGYDKSVWTAPLLGHYLQEAHGVSITPQRLRGALKDLGYHWKHTHYAYLRPGTGRHH